jgi:hypothetical protein
MAGGMATKGTRDHLYSTAFSKQNIRGAQAAMDLGAAVKSKSGQRRRESEDGVRNGEIEREEADLILLVENCEAANASACDRLHLNRGNVIAKERGRHGGRHTNEEGKCVSQGRAAVMSARLKPSIHSMVMTRCVCSRVYLQRQR